MTTRELPDLDSSWQSPAVLHLCKAMRKRASPLEGLLARMTEKDL